MKTRRQGPLTLEWLKSQTIEDSNGCWIWQRALNHDGYGWITFEGRPHGTHRVMYTLSYRDFDEQLHVLHHCDVRSCINPEHLYQGTQQQNVQDMVDRKRVADHHREANPNAKLTEAQVRAIRLDKRSVRIVADNYPVGPSQIHRIRTRGHW